MNETPTIASLLPHAAPMIFLDALVEWDTDRAVCQATIRPTTHFVEDGKLEAIVCMEHMAQCVAAWVGLDDRRANEVPKIGFIIACRELNLLVDWLSVGDRLTVESRRAWGDAELGNFECTVHRDGTLVANARMSAYRGDVDTPRDPTNP